MGHGGGKREGSGRKPGAAWASGKPRPVRKVARANLLGVMEGGRDPLMGLLEIAEDRSLDPDVRVRAYVGALPFCRPRLSMQVVADATPRDGAASVSQEALLERMVRMLDRLAPPRAIEGEAVDLALAGPGSDV